jgi:uncharacterized protein (TIGR03435 family)
MISVAVVAILKATLVCGAALLLARACRHARASIRHLLFALAFAALIAIPAAEPIMPAVRVMLPAAAASPADAAPEVIVSALPSAGRRPNGESDPAISEAGAAASPLTIPQVLVVFWLIGVAVFLLPVVAGFWQVRRLRRTAIPWTRGQALLRSLASDRAAHRRTEVVLHDAVSGPITCGVLRPLIVLPVAVQDWDEASLRRSLRHELEHVARRDLLTNCLSRIVCAAYWFHPLVWVAWRRLRLEAEKACDDAVVLEDDARDYAALLVSMAQPAASGQPPLLAMASRDDLTARVAALLDQSQRRGPVGRRLAAGLIVVAAAAMVGIAPIAVARAMPEAQVAGAVQATTFADASIKRLPPAQLRQIDGRIIATGLTVQNLLTMAFGVRDVVNAPLWVRMDRFDIVANAPLEITKTQESKNLQALLAERFKLVAHRETRDFPVYALVLARPDGSLGPQLTPSKMDCSRRDSIRARAVTGAVPAAAAGELPNCSTTSSDGRIAGGGVTLEELARNLPTHLRFYGTGRMFAGQLIDRTGLTGRFDFRMEWEQDVAGSSGAAAGPPEGPPSMSALESSAPRFLAALQQQLGLKIETQMAPAPVLVIDSIEPPMEN